MRARRRGVVLALCLLLALLLSACGTQAQPARRELDHLILAVPPSPSLAPVYVAQDQGYFEDAGLRVQLLEQSVGVLAMEALLAGEADIAAVADPPMARAVLNGREPALIATFDRVSGLTYIVARQDRGIEDAEDLIGKRVGVIKDNIGHYFLYVYLVTSGIDPSLVEIVFLAPDAMVPSVVNGDVDAISWAPPSTLRAAESLGSNAVLLEKPGLYTVTWSFATMPSIRPERQDQLVRFLKAVNRANTFIRENPEQAQAITAEAAGQSLGDLQEHWASHEFDLALDQTLILTLQDVASWMLGGEDTVPSFVPYVDTRPLRAVRPETVTIVEPRDTP